MTAKIPPALAFRDSDDDILEQVLGEQGAN
jgi:hypothetical protein